MMDDRWQDNEKPQGDMPSQMGHEKLRVYQHGLKHVAWIHSLLTSIDESAAVLDHWGRAGESIVENIANGNSRRSRADRNQYFDVAIGSALECAACLDICLRRGMITQDQVIEGKKSLQSIVNMTIRLREAQSDYLRESRDVYAAGESSTYFAHEGLECYKVSLDLILWFHEFLAATELGLTSVKRLDKATTSIVLNVAEGNGRFSDADQVRFLDIAHTCAMRAAAYLDVLVVREKVGYAQIADGKRILARIVPLILGLRGYLDDSNAEG